MRIKRQCETFAYRLAAEDYSEFKKKKYPEAEVIPDAVSNDKTLNATPKDHSSESYESAAKAVGDSASGPRVPKMIVTPGAPSSGGYSGYSAGGNSSGGSSSSYSGGSHADSVERWRSNVEEGLRRNGLPTSYADQVLHQIQTESSGNPTAINNWDSNAAAGTPSQGLLQTIPSTFQQYHHEGDSMDITDPQANIDSAIGYAKTRYGPTLMDSSGNGMGSGRGY